MRIEQNMLGPRPEIQILRKRTSIIVLVFFSLCCLLQSFYFFMISIINIFYQHNLYYEVFFLSIALMEFVVFGWFLGIGTVRHLFFHNPVLIINCQGIQISKLPMVAGDDLFISWEEIEMIYVRRFWGSTYFSICPKNTDAFLARFHGLKRFNLYIRAHAPINILQMYLRLSIAEIIQEINAVYGDKVLEYGIQIYL